MLIVISLNLPSPKIILEVSYSIACVCSSEIVVAVLLAIVLAKLGFSAFAEIGALASTGGIFALVVAVLLAMILAKPLLHAFARIGALASTGSVFAG